ncbi:AAA domain-containing protein [Helicobacter pylori]|uniref:AAA domain-containing protein n=1 Tax=Helicobacter pylori TaxID=210 RepID=UPI00311A145D
MDAFQGEEADIIIYSTVKTCGNLSFLLDSKRLNVAISRAKENLSGCLSRRGGRYYYLFHRENLW